MSADRPGDIPERFLANFSLPSYEVPPPSPISQEMWDAIDEENEEKERDRQLARQEWADAHAERKAWQTERTAVAEERVAMAKERAAWTEERERLREARAEDLADTKRTNFWTAFRSWAALAVSAGALVVAIAKSPSEPPPSPAAPAPVPGAVR